MNTKMIWANLPVKDITRTTKFYTDLGFKPNTPNNDPELASFLFGEDNFVIHFFTHNRFTSGLFGEIVNTRQTDPLPPEQCDPLRTLFQKSIN